MFLFFNLNFFRCKRINGFFYILDFRNVTTVFIQNARTEVATFELYLATNYNAAIFIQFSDSEKSLISFLSAPLQRHNEEEILTA